MFFKALTTRRDWMAGVRLNWAYKHRRTKKDYCLWWLHWKGQCYKVSVNEWVQLLYLNRFHLVGSGQYSKMNSIQTSRNVCFCLQRAVIEYRLVAWKKCLSKSLVSSPKASNLLKYCQHKCFHLNIYISKVANVTHLF